MGVPRTTPYCCSPSRYSQYIYTLDRDDWNSCIVQMVIPMFPCTRLWIWSVGRMLRQRLPPYSIVTINYIFMFESCFMTLSSAIHHSHLHTESRSQSQPSQRSSHSPPPFSCICQVFFVPVMEFGTGRQVSKSTWLSSMAALTGEDHRLLIRHHSPQLASDMRLG